MAFKGKLHYDECFTLSRRYLVVFPSERIPLIVQLIFVEKGIVCATAYLRIMYPLRCNFYIYVPRVREEKDTRILSRRKQGRK